MLSSVGIALLLLLVAVLLFVRYQAAKKTRVAPERTSELEMEIHPPKNEDRMVISFVFEKSLTKLNFLTMINNFNALLKPAKTN